MLSNKDKFRHSSTKMRNITNVSDSKELLLTSEQHPPNIFLYLQLVSIKALPPNIENLEIHLKQGNSLIIKCDEEYNTAACIHQAEFNSKPTFTLIFQQDNLDKINYAADNPLLIMIYMRNTITHSRESTEGEKIGQFYNFKDGTGEESLEAPRHIKLDNVTLAKKQVHKEDTEISYHDDDKELVLLCVGYIDLIKLFGHRRSMIKEELYLYPIPDVPNELRFTVHSEWHLYTLLPIAKELTFTNMAFITLESIYNLKEEYAISIPSLRVELNFRSTLPNEKNEYVLIPLCSFNNLVHECIGQQNIHHIFEYFRRCIQPCNATGLKSTMEVELHKLFAQLMFSEGLNVDLDFIDTSFEEAAICNSFHRYILTQKMSKIIFNSIAFRNYVLAVDVWQTNIETSKRHKVFEGVLDPAILLYPGVQTMRFAVELEYVGKRNYKSNRQTIVSILSQRSGRIDRMPLLPTFAIIKICLLAPLTEVYNELKVFRESFISQNRLLFCDSPFKEPKTMDLVDIQSEAYARFDKFMSDCVRYIIEKNVHSIEDKKQHFCCALQNLTNILLKLVGCDFNTRIPTKSNTEFTNLCSIAFNVLELRVHNIVESLEDEGFEYLVVSSSTHTERLIDHMNAIKLLRAVGDDYMAQYLHDKVCYDNQNADLFDFYMLIAHMEVRDFSKAKSYFIASRKIAEVYEYFAGWIGLYINYIDTRGNLATSANATECLLNSITQYAERHIYQQDGWILLYCYYKRFHYEPGCAYARLRFEDQIKQTRSSASLAPYSLWGIYLNIYPEFSNQRGVVFYDVFKVFVRLGLYEFGRVVFSTVEYQCREADRYMINAQLDILLGTLDDNFELRTFNFSNNSSADNLRSSGFNAQVNASVEYYRKNFISAAGFYAENLKSINTNENERDQFLISKLRLAYLSYESGNYNMTINALKQPVAGKLISLACSYMLGKSYYKLENYEMAQLYFAKSTSFGSHFPNIWAYLALINLKTGKNYNAIECWKYAKMDPTKFVSEEFIFHELKKLDYYSMDLYIDQPELTNNIIFVDSVNENYDSIKQN